MVSTAHHPLPASRLLPFLVVVAGVSACGGGSSDAIVASVPVANTYPTGLAVGSPTDVSDGSVTLAAAQPSVSGLRYAMDWGRATWDALRSGDLGQVRRLAAQGLPLSTAHAALGDPGLLSAADLLEKILSGDASVTDTELRDLIKLSALFGENNSNANCYGPQVAYGAHQDTPSSAPPSSGTLPSGDVGIWLENETRGSVSEACVAAQMNKRVRGASLQSQQALLMAALMRRTVAASGTLSMPSAGATTDLTSAFTARLAAIMTSPPTIVSATVGLGSGGVVYTYRLVLTNGASGSSQKRGEMILRHTPGGSSTAYNGTLQVAGFSFGADPNFGCSDQKSGADYKVAYVTSVKYSRSAGDVGFSARQSHYCGHPATMTGVGTDDAAEVATFTTGGELNPTVKIAQVGSPSPQAGVKGWRGDFTRYAGDYQRSTASGQFLLAWQAGPGDGFSRSLAATGEFNSATLVRTVKGYFAYASDIDTASAPFEQKGMICNWAGPGSSRTPVMKFQSQTATKASGAAFFSVSGASRITYAPTNSCNSSGTAFDVDASGTISPMYEGNPTTNNLDGLTGTSTTVDQEVRSRGWTKPSLF